MRTQAILIVFAMLSSSAAADQGYFVSVGDLPGGNNWSWPEGISGNGRVVVGSSSSSHGRWEAFRWTMEGGMVALPDIDDRNEVQSFASDANYDGSVIVGNVARADDNVKAFRWTDESGMVDLGDLPGGGRYPYSSATSVSGDGKVVGGESVSKESYPDAEAFIWTEAEGMRSSGETPDGALPRWIFDLCGDGQIAITSLEASAYVRRSEGEWEKLTAWENSLSVQAEAISADGKTIVGAATVTIDGLTAGRAFRWTEAEGMQDLGYFGDGTWKSAARHVSGDGKVIVGSGGPFYENYGRLFIWDAEHGLRNLPKVLVEEFGLDLSNWMLGGISGLSDDGRTITGNGINFEFGQQGWVAHIPRCNRFKYPLGDSDGSGSVDFNDIDCFVAALISKDAWVSCGTGAPSDHYDCVNDTNDDGSVDFWDIDSFVACLSDGCE